MQNYIGLDHTCMGSCCLLSISGWKLHLGLEFCISYVHHTSRCIKLFRLEVKVHGQ